MPLREDAELPGPSSREQKLDSSTLNLAFENRADGLAGWEIYGKPASVAVDTDEPFDGARSIRLAGEKDGRIVVARALPVDQLRGKHVRFSAAFRSRSVREGHVGIFVRINTNKGEHITERMKATGISGDTDWQRREVFLPVPLDAETVLFGAILVGEGDAWVDGLGYESTTAEFPVSGAVADAGGRSVEAVLAFVPESGVKAVRVVRVNSDGDFSTKLPPGRYGVTATGAAGVAASHVSIGGTAEPKRIALVMQPALKHATGRCVTVRGDSPPPGFIRAEQVGEEDGRVFYFSTAADGQFMALLPDGRFVLEYEHGEYWSDGYEVQDDASGLELRVYSLQQLSAPAPQATTAWLRERIVPLTSVRANSGFADLQPLKALIGDARIVAMGEATHGTKEFFQLKHRVLEFLVEEMGFSVFAMEANWPESEQMNEYVLHGTGEPKKILADLQFWTWQTEEVVELVEWMREYNADPDHKRKVTFIGIDMQYTHNAAKQIVVFLKRVDEKQAGRTEKALAPLFDERSPWNYGKLSEAEREAVREHLKILAKRLMVSRRKLVRRSSLLDWQKAMHNLRVLNQAERMWSNVGRARSSIRDQAMAENALAHSKEDPNGGRMLLWAHNLHVANGSWGNGVVSMGAALKALVGEDYISIGFIFNRGSFRAYDWVNGRDASRGLLNLALPPAPAGTVEQVFASATSGNAILDLRNLPNDAVATWLRSPHMLRYVTSVFYGAFASAEPAVLTEEFDAVLFVHSSSPAVPVVDDALSEKP